MKLLIMSSLVFGIACGDDDALPTFDGGTPDSGMLPDVPGIDVPTVDAGDPCMGVDPADRCGTAGITCSGDTLTTCEENATGCLVTTEADCSTDGGTCDDSGAVAMCSGDPCMGVTNCEAEARSCGDDTLTVCAPDAMGCLVSTETDCTVDGTTCDDTGAMAVCVDACEGISDCDTESRSCDMDNLVVCAPDAAGCLVETATDCAGIEATCEDTADPVACVAIPCAPADASGVTLDCDSGTIMGTTMGGTEAFVGYCGGGSTSYDSPEAVFRFGDARSATVTVTAVRDAASSLDMDLFAIDGGDGTAVCGGDTDCLATGTGFTDTEVVTFDYLPGGTNYIAYDAFNGAAETTDFTLTVECEFSTCGDSVIEGPEACDDGGAVAMDGCSDLCQVEPGYLCTEDGAGLSTCELSCGDGLVNGDDECDDMNGTDADGCTACVVDMGYSCSGEPSVCELTCGDGDFDADAGEFCDDGNADNGDGCAMDCTVEADFACANDDGETSICSPTGMSIDGVLEDMDTAWTRPGATCTAGSTDTVFELVEYTNTTGAEQTVDILVNYAYDGYVHVFTDTVDPANPTTSCVAGNDDFHSTANGLIQDVVIADGATIYIAVSAFGGGRGEFSVHVTDAGFGCGNGLTDVPGDDCDDGNAMGGDGCSAACAPEDGFECDDAEPSVCAALVCGNGIIQTGEECDDMDMDSGDGCSDICEIETDYVCEGEPSVCITPVCGNGIVEAGEVCDGGAGCAVDCASAVFTGALEVGDDTWSRPFSSCGSRSGSQFYDAVPFTWDGLVDETLTFTVAWDGVDGYLHAFSDPFTAADSPTGCITGDDDFGSPAASGSQMTVPMTAGLTINAIMSTFGASPGNVGGWTLTVTR